MTFILKGIHHRLILTAALLLLCFSSFGENTVIKTALVTPEGSAWTNLLHQMAGEVAEKTGGAVTFKIYAGGVSGDELDVIRKMKVNRIHAAGFSGVGMGVLLPEFRILEAPMMYRNYAEVDAVKAKLRETFSTDLEKQGYVLLDFAEAGFVYLFSKKDPSDPEWINTAKMWAWKGDPVADQFFKANGIKTFPLNLSDVNTGLETGMIDSFYSPPLGALAFQWHAKVQYMLDCPMVNSSGALILKKEIYDRISPNHQKILKDTARKYCERLVQATRKDNEEAIKIMARSGVAIVKPSGDQVQRFRENARTARESSIPTLYTKDLLTRVQKILETLRAETSKPRSGS